MVRLLSLKIAAIELGDNGIRTGGTLGRAQPSSQ